MSTSATMGARREAEPAEGGWDRLLSRHRPGLQAAVRGFMRRCGWRPRQEEVEELVQEVLVRLVEARRSGRAPGVEGPPQLAAYLRRTARSVVIDALRARTAAKRGSGRVVLDAEVSEGGLIERLVDPGGSPEDRLLAAERWEALRRRIAAAIPDAQRRRNMRILEMVLIEGYSSGEVAARLGSVAASTVNTVVHRLRQRLSGGAHGPPRRRAEAVTP